MIAFTFLIFSEEHHRDPSYGRHAFFLPFASSCMLYNDFMKNQTGLMWDQSVSKLLLVLVLKHCAVSGQ